jgi:hypothetical protein
MNNYVEALAESLIRLGAIPSERRKLDQKNLQSSYLYFLSLCNGGYTPDYFLHFFGTAGPRAHNLRDWNDLALWKAHYCLTNTDFVFAEDIFANQFFFDARANRRVVKILTADNGKVSLCANTFEDFIEDEVFGDEFNREARKLARSFLDSKHVRYEPFTHIACKTPVVFGGSQADVENLELIESVDNIAFLGQIVSQTKNLPPGTKINRVHREGGK